MVNRRATRRSDPSAIQHSRSRNAIATATANSPEIMPKGTPRRDGKQSERCRISVLVRRGAGLCNVFVQFELSTYWSDMVEGYGPARASSRPAPSARATPLDDALRPENRSVRECRCFARRNAGAVPRTARGGHDSVGDFSFGCFVDGWPAGG